MWECTFERGISNMDGIFLVLIFLMRSFLQQVHFRRTIFHLFNKMKSLYLSVR